MTAFTAFNTAFTRDHALRLIQTGDDDRAYQKLMTDEVNAMVGDLLKALSAEGVIGAIDAPGRRINFVDSWNAVAEGRFGTEWDSEHHVDAVVLRLGHALIFHPIYEAGLAVAKGADLQDEAAKAHAGILAAVEKGDIDWFRYMIDLYCMVDGERGYFEMKGWKASVGRVAGSRDLVPLPPIEVGAVETLEFDVGSGELLIADWFWIDGLKDLLEKTDEQNDIGSELGCINETRRYLRDHGVIHVFAGNSSPQVWLDGDEIVLGNPGYDEDEDVDLDPAPLVEVGRTSTTLWWTTIVPRERLEALAAQAVGIDKAREAVDQAIAEHEGRMTVLKVTHGVRHLYFSGKPERFEDEFYSPDLNIPAGFQTQMVLSTKPLTIEPRPAPGPALSI